MIGAAEGRVDGAPPIERSSRWPVWLSVVVGACLSLLAALRNGWPGGLTWFMILAASTALGVKALTSSSRMRGLVALCFGIAGLSVGIGVGLRWFLAGVVAWQVIVSAVMLPAGLVLIGFGLSKVSAGARSLVRGLVVFLLLTLALVAVWIATPAVMATNVPPTVDPAATVDLGLGGQPVRFDTADGVSLWGWYVPPTDGRVVVVRHGSGSTAETLVPVARVLVESGYGVLLTDARGHGRSGGEGMDFGWNGEADIVAAVSFLAGRPEVDVRRMAVLGLSMGGEEAIGAAGVDPRISAVVAEGATARTDEDKVWLAERYGWRGSLQLELEWLQYALVELLSGVEKPASLATAARSAAPTPILMISAAQVPDETHAARFIADAAGGNVALWTVPDAGHVQGLAVAPEDWARQVVGFLDETLAVGAG